MVGLPFLVAILSWNSSFWGHIAMVASVLLGPSDVGVPTSGGLRREVASVSRPQYSWGLHLMVAPCSGGLHSVVASISVWRPTQTIYYSLGHRFHDLGGRTPTAIY